ncbi:MAG: M20/M25/M40 family metallo-hydrolase [Bacteroidetes bacterium]|nr:MAG: M20/M25/M40 family metallo-hydrolase [Bacteroidota bacterium]
MKHLTSTFLMLAFLYSATAFGQASLSISANHLHTDVAYLASDQLQGRGAGTKSERKAAKYLAREFKKAGLAPMGTNGSYFHQFEFKKPSDPHGNVAANAPTLKSRNVAAYLDNGAPYTIVIGAHYDHLGLGHDHNSRDVNPVGKVHNGADDNASGTAGVLELARYFANNGIKEQHNFLFLCFSGEELGLIGSKKYTESPTIDLTKVSFMLNMDMIGRLNDEKRMVVGGVGTSPTFVPLLNGMETGLTIKQDSAGIGPSDHTSFYLKNIPVLFFFTGQHEDYHKPSDDVEKVNFDGQKEILEFAVQLIGKLDQEPKLTFQETKAKKEDTPRFKVTLGIMPDYTWDGDGLHVDGVIEDRPASRAGLQQGDIIVRIGDLEIHDIRDYMKALSMFEKGNTTKVKVMRKGAAQEMEVTF